jgi:hypothetical protein
MIRPLARVVAGLLFAAAAAALIYERVGVCGSSWCREEAVTEALSFAFAVTAAGLGLRLLESPRRIERRFADALRSVRR